MRDARNTCFQAVPATPFVWAQQHHRRCPLSVTRRSVSVDTVVEGSVRIDSGGAATVARSRGGDLVVRCCGPATVGEAAAQTDIDTRGGDVRITRLAGRDVRIVTSGGSVHVGSAFVERLRIDTSPSAAAIVAADRGGGAVIVGSLRVEESAEVRAHKRAAISLPACSSLATSSLPGIRSAAPATPLRPMLSPPNTRQQISTGGGAVTLWGLDGSGAERTAVRSRGGRVEAQLHERANALLIDSQARSSTGEGVPPPCNKCHT